MMNDLGSLLALDLPPVSSPARRRRARGLACLALALSLGCSDDDDSATPPETTYASWAAASQDYFEPLPFPGAPAAEPTSFDGQTLRQIVRTSAGGEALRIQLSNLFGDAPVVVDPAGVARSIGADAIDAGSHVALTFDGAATVSLAPGEERWSDFVPFSLPDQADIAVSLELGTAPVRNVHTLGQQTAYLAAGDAASAPTLPAASTRESYYWLSRIEVRGPAAPRVVVAFGDSITDGYNSTVDANRRYPNELSRRLTSLGDPAEYSVVNAGISGNRVLSDVIGPSGISRFARDVLEQRGVTDVILLLGINDIGFAGIVPEQAVSADEITAGLAQMADAAEGAGVRVHLGTLLPFEGTMPPYYSEENEAKRQAVNAWIRDAADVTSVIDFDRVMQDPANPRAMLPQYASPDFLHPDDDGYAAMAEAVDIGTLQ
jgi:lysophospholipase L1-like esterase